MKLYRPLGLNELRLIYEAEMAAFPPRLPGQPIFYPVLNLAYAEQIARDWNTKRDPFAGYVTEFEIDDSYVSQFEPQRVGGNQHLELWVPAESIDAFNRHIDAPIVVPVGFFGDGFVGEIPERFMLRGRTALEQFQLLSEVLASNGMDFVCEVSANDAAVFLNYPFWLCCSSEDTGLSEERQAEVLEAIRRCWAEREVEIQLPAEGERVA